jgi:hypothetical protein
MNHREAAAGGAQLLSVSSGDTQERCAHRYRKDQSLDHVAPFRDHSFWNASNLKIKPAKVVTAWVTRPIGSPSR